MTGARAAAAALVAGAALLPVARVARAAPAEIAAATPAAPAHPATYPLVLLVQGDAVAASTPDDGDVAAGTSNDAPFGSGLRLRRLRVGEDVRFGAWRIRTIFEATSRGQPSARVDGGHLPDAGTVRLTEAFGAWIPTRAFQVTAGAQRVPFSLSRQVDEAELRLPERAQIVAAVAPDYRAGVAVGSDLGLLDVRLAAMSASTRLDDQLFSRGFLYAFRLSADPIGPMGVTPWHRRDDDPWYGWWRFSAGLSILYGTLLESRTFAIGGDAQLQWRRLTITGEYVGEYVGSATPTSNGAAWPHQGAVVEPGVFLVAERLELVLRGAWYRRPLDPATSPGGSADTLAGGAGLSLLTHHGRLRLQAGFEARRTVHHELPDGGWGIFRATFSL